MPRKKKPKYKPKLSPPKPRKKKSSPKKPISKPKKSSRKNLVISSTKKAKLNQAKINKRKQRPIFSAIFSLFRPKKVKESLPPNFQKNPTLRRPLEKSVLLKTTRRPKTKKITESPAISIDEISSLMDKVYEQLELKNMTTSKSTFHKLVVQMSKLSPTQRDQVYPSFLRLERAMQRTNFSVKMDKVHSALADQKLFAAKDLYDKSSN
tara:strand:+ start:3092 stop:3715 length:624 start_codon:yes stop_codon:yes gene_type:complete